MKRRSIVLTIAATALATALFVSAVPAVAGVGDALILGNNNSGGNKTTAATANVDGPAFKFTNNFGGKKAAARINTGCGAGNKFDCAPPFATDSSAKVLNFNADYLDGYSADDVKVLAAGDRDTDVPDNQTEFDALSTTLTVPVDGVLTVTATADAYEDGGGPDSFQCWIDVDGTMVDGSYIYAEFDDGDNTEEDCTTVAIEEVSAGTYDVDYVISSWDTDNSIDEGTMTVLFVPGPLAGSSLASAAPSAGGGRGE